MKNEINENDHIVIEKDIIFSYKILFFILTILLIVILTLGIQNYMINKKESLLVNKSIVDSNGIKIDSTEKIDISIEMMKLKFKNLNGYEFIKIEDNTKNRSY